jgi:hypothetical protein
MRLNPQISPQTIRALRSQYGLDQPLLVRYERWMRSALHADLGYSIAYNLPVAPLLWSRAKNTLLLTTDGAVSDLADLGAVGRVDGEPARRPAGSSAVGLLSCLAELRSRAGDCRFSAGNRGSLANLLPSAE